MQLLQCEKTYVTNVYEIVFICNAEMLSFNIQNFNKLVEHRPFH